MFFFFVITVKHPNRGRHCELALAADPVFVHTKELAPLKCIMYILHVLHLVITKYTIANRLNEK